MWTVFALLSPAASAATCDRAGLAVVLEVLEAVSDRERSLIAAKGLSEVCTAPTGWVEGLTGWAVAPGPLQGSIDLKVAAETPDAWTAVCRGGPEVLTVMAQAAPSEHRALLWQRCELDRHGWLTEGQWLAADGPMVVPLVGGHALTEAGISSGDVGTLVRALAGVGATASARLQAVETEGSGEPTGTPAGFAPGGRVAPSWSDTAKVGDTCRVRVFVTPEGRLQEWVRLACAPALERAVRTGLEASTFEPVAGRFEVTYTVD